MDRKETSLTVEEKALFLELKHLDVYKVIIKVLNLLAQEQSESVLKLDLSQKSDRDLALLKARADGASKVVRDFHAVASKTTKRDAK